MKKFQNGKSINRADIRKRDFITESKMKPQTAERKRRIILKIYLARLSKAVCGFFSQNFI
jgi:hypothetical protein